MHSSHHRCQYPPLSDTESPTPLRSVMLRLLVSLQYLYLMKLPAVQSVMYCSQLLLASLPVQHVMYCSQLLLTLQPVVYCSQQLLALPIVRHVMYCSQLLLELLTVQEVIYCSQLLFEVLTVWHVALLQPEVSCLVQRPGACPAPAGDMHAQETDKYLGP